MTGQPSNHRRVHRVVWMMAHGPLPAGVQVLHTCDNPPCGRLTHLFEGTHTDNMRDKVEKGRWRGQPLRRVELTCIHCGRPFVVHLRRAATARFCSLQCRKDSRDNTA